MEGYSVTEAASVLGVPTERVWELLARGILSGVSDGEAGMRVFLQPRPAPQPVDEPRASNGHGTARGTDAEASPFRELLTEFRGLTERYGQALLALGEARGEVASLRSRVDLLEARMDLRLPFSSPVTPEPRRRASDRRAMAPAEAVEQDVMHEPGAQGDAEPEGERPPRRRRGRSRFGDEFADALARAEDPSPAVLRDRGEADSAVAVHQDRDDAAEAEAAELALPRELPAAEAMAVMEPEPEVAVLSADRLTEAPPEAEPEPMADVAPTREPEAEHEAEPEPWLPPASTREPEPEPVLAAEQEPIAGPPPVDDEPGSFAAPRMEALVPDLQPIDALAPSPGTEAQAEPEPRSPAEPELVLEVEPMRDPEAELIAEIDAQAGPEPEREPSAAAEAELELAPEPELVLEVEPMRDPEAEPVAQVEIDAQAGPEPEPEPSAVAEHESEPVSYGGPDLGPPAVDDEPAPVTAERREPDDRFEPPFEPRDAPSIGAEPAFGAVAGPEADPVPEPLWDRAQYTTQIEEPDWWTPEESLWPEPEVSAPDWPEATPEHLQPSAPAGDEPAPSAPASLAEEGTGDPTGGVEERPASRQPRSDEETVLWLGRPSERSESVESRSEDAAGEMEVASTGHRGRLSPEGSSDLPGGQELDDALAGLDGSGWQRPTIGLEGGAPSVVDAAPERPGMSTEPARAPLPRLGEPAGPASRAYRRLRRIFPG